MGNQTVENTLLCIILIGIEHIHTSTVCGKIVRHHTMVDMRVRNTQAAAL